MGILTDDANPAVNMMKVDKIASVFGRVLVDDYERHKEAAHAVISHITACPKVWNCQCRW